MTRISDGGGTSRVAPPCAGAFLPKARQNRATSKLLVSCRITKSYHHSIGDEKLWRELTCSMIFGRPEYSGETNADCVSTSVLQSCRCAGSSRFPARTQRGQ